MSCSADDHKSDNKEVYTSPDGKEYTSDELLDIFLIYFGNFYEKKDGSYPLVKDVLKLCLSYVSIPDDWDNSHDRKMSYPEHIAIYLEYYEEHTSFYISPGDSKFVIDDMIIDANFNRSCELEMYFDTEVTSKHCESYCEGWTLGDRRCHCGAFKGYRWVRCYRCDSLPSHNNDKCCDFEYRPENYSIYAKRPIGYVELMW